MFQNNSNNNTTTNDSITGRMPGGMPESTPQDNNDTQFHQQGHAGLNSFTNKPRIVGGPSKIQAGLNRALGEQNSVNNNVSDQNDNGFIKTSGFTNDNVHNSIQNTNPSTGDGHRSLQSHHKGLGNEGLRGGSDGMVGSHNQPVSNNFTHVGGASNSGNDHHYGRDAALGADAAGIAKHELSNHNEKTSANPLSSSHHTGSDPLSSEYDGLNSPSSYQHGSNPLSSSQHGHSNSLSSSSHIGSNPMTDSNNNNHHYVRDAAIGAGAAGIAKHKLGTHKNSSNPNPVSSDNSPVSGINNKEHHYGRDAAVAGGAAVAGKELKDHHDNQRNSNVTTGRNSTEEHKPLNTGGDAHHIAEQPLLYTDGGLTGNQPVGEVNFRKL